MRTPSTTHITGPGRSRSVATRTTAAARTAAAAMPAAADHHVSLRLPPLRRSGITTAFVVDEMLCAGRFPSDGVVAGSVCSTICRCDRSPAADALRPNNGLKGCRSAGRLLPAPAKKSLSVASSASVVSPANHRSVSALTSLYSMIHDFCQLLFQRSARPRQRHSHSRRLHRRHCRYLLDLHALGIPQHYHRPLALGQGCR